MAYNDVRAKAETDAEWRERTARLLADARAWGDTLRAGAPDLLEASGEAFGTDPDDDGHPGPRRRPHWPAPRLRNT